MIHLYCDLHNVSGVENLTSCKATLKLFTLNFGAIFTKGIIYNDLNTDRLLRKLLINLQKEFFPEKIMVDYI